MCGFVGVLAAEGERPAASLLDPMLDVMRYRGPDDRGTWSGGRIALGHLRLTILDLTVGGHQPVTAPDGRSALVYNGEVYNYASLRERLEREGVRVRGTGDTGVVFEALRHWGPEAAVEAFDGMFAFAYWDAAEQTLWLGRDRLGIKPLYVARAGSTLLFASEIKALLAHPGVPARPDFRWLPRILMVSRVVGSRTLFEGVESLTPGSLWRVGREGTVKRRYFDPERYVDPDRIRAASRTAPAAAAERFEALLERSVELHLASDVPLATLLSGGVDSSLVAALARRRLPGIVAYVADVGGEISEWPAAQRVARHLGIRAERVRIRREDYLRLVPRVTWHLDAPMAIASDPALLTVTRRCHEDGVKVLLTGEGSDELFGGYPWQVSTWAMWRKREGLLYRLRTRRKRRERDVLRLDTGPLHSDLARHVPPLRWRLLSLIDAEVELAGRRILQRLASIEPPSDRAFLAACIHDLDRHLPSLLQRHDRMGMAASIETRVPFLETELIAFGLDAPRRWKVHRGRSKCVVKAAAERHLPRDLVHAKKKGWPVPPAFRRGMLGILENGVLADLLGWSAATPGDLARLARADPDGAHRLAYAEVWARVFLRGDDPDEVGERLVAATAGSAGPPAAVRVPRTMET